MIQEGKYVQRAKYDKSNFDSWKIDTVFQKSMKESVYGIWRTPIVAHGHAFRDAELRFDMNDTVYGTTRTYSDSGRYQMTGEYTFKARYRFDNDTSMVTREVFADRQVVRWDYIAFRKLEDTLTYNLKKLEFRDMNDNWLNALQGFDNVPPEVYIKDEKLTAEMKKTAELWAKRKNKGPMKNRIWFCFGFLFLVAVSLSFCTLATGPVWVSWPDFFSALFAGPSAEVGADSITSQIIWRLRVPRMCAAVLAGTSLSVAGLALQTVFCNPLAGPFVLGISSGASLGVALSLLAGFSFGNFGVLGAAASRRFGRDDYCHVGFGAVPQCGCALDRGAFARVLDRRYRERADCGERGRSASRVRDVEHG
jgi:ABC-type Fe3+-siderophore transport system, permease component